ncbi:MAG: hypothetical protein DSY46_04840, partial [Hydrogenimonas sp.]
LDIYNNEKVVKNFDNSARECPVCLNLRYEKGGFDAWDAWRNITDRNISTKLVGETFDLTIASLNRDNTATETKENIDIQFTLYNQDNNTYLANWSKFDANQSETINQSFTATSAQRKVSVLFKVCADYNGTVYTLYPYNDCNSECDTLDTKCWRFFNSSDAFAVRPKYFTDFEFNTTLPLKAAQPFRLSVKATDLNDDDPTSDYNTTLSTIDINISDTTKLCAFMHFDHNISSIRFDDGQGATESNITEVGEVNITVIDNHWVDWNNLGRDGECNNSSECVAVYGPDGKDSNNVYCCNIEGSINSVTIIPDHFTITNTSFNNYMNHPFTYLHNINNFYDMFSELNMTISAENYSNELTKNYSSGCYAKSTQLHLSLQNLNITPSGTLNHLIVLGFSPFDINETNLTFDFDESIFTNGNAILNFAINFDRNSTQAVNPFDLNITQIDLNDTDQIEGNTSLNQSVRFYYGRLHAPDYRTAQDSLTTPIYVEVFCDPSVITCSNFGINDWNESVDDINWWINPLHTDSDGNITEINATLIDVLDNMITINGSTTGRDTNIHTLPQGIYIPTIEYTGTARPHQVRIFLSAGEWLMYHPFFEPAKVYYNIIFEGSSSDWGGTGDLGQIVDLNASQNSSYRIEW